MSLGVEHAVRMHGEFVAVGRVILELDFDDITYLRPDGRAKNTEMSRLRLLVCKAAVSILHVADLFVGRANPI